MEKNVTPENIKMYISWRDEFFKVVTEELCKKCTDPRKDKQTINYDDPLNCKCRCDRVENLLIRAANLDSDIKLYSSSSC